VPLDAIREFGFTDPKDGPTAEQIEKLNWCQENFDIPWKKATSDGGLD